ncbi:MAG TPA: N-acetylmuramoyl-L-alanine amidase, partial [Woeseiaceae bacterium]|nr:N-acetylmuramoyl-L-alanine amidase [Woeseiaceae bacterium]
IRDADVYVDLRERMDIARRNNADLFVSIHADAVGDRRAKGASVYVLSLEGASDEAAKLLAERENASGLIGGVSLADKDDLLASVLLDLSQNAALSASLTVGADVLGELENIGAMHRRKVQQAGFLVLKSRTSPPSSSRRRSSRIPPKRRGCAAPRIGSESRTRSSPAFAAIFTGTRRPIRRSRWPCVMRRKASCATSFRAAIP